MGAVVFKGGKVLLVKRLKPPQQGLWAIPGGSVELGETLQKAAEREILEETGLTIRAGKPVHCFDLIERDPDGRVLFHYVIVDVEAEYLGGELLPAEDARDARWFDPGDLDTLPLSQNTRLLLQKNGFLP